VGSEASSLMSITGSFITTSDAADAVLVAAAEGDTPAPNNPG